MLRSNFVLIRRNLRKSYVVLNNLFYCEGVLQGVRPFVHIFYTDTTNLIKLFEYNFYTLRIFR